MTDTDMLIAQRDALAKVVARCFNITNDGYDISDTDFRYALFQAGLIVGRTATAEEAEIHECDVGDLIYHPTALFSDALKAAKS